MGEDFSRVLFRTECGERRDDGKRDGRYSNELEEAREDGRNEAEECV